MRKIIWIILPAALLVLLCGCGKQADAKPGSDTAAEASSAAEQAVLQTGTETVEGESEAVIPLLPDTTAAGEAVPAEKKVVPADKADAKTNVVTSPNQTVASASAAVQRTDAAAATKAQPSTAAPVTKTQPSTTVPATQSVPSKTAKAEPSTTAAAKPQPSTGASGKPSTGSVQTIPADTFTGGDPIVNPGAKTTTGSETLPTADQNKERFELPAIPLQ